MKEGELNVSIAALETMTFEEGMLSMLDTEEICQLAGIIIIVGALYLIFKEKIFLDAQTKEVMFVELPTIGKVKTNAPVLAIFLFGLIAILYPVYSRHTHYVSVRQHIESASLPFDVYGVAQMDSVGRDGELRLSIPLLHDESYRPKLVLTVGCKSIPESLNLNSADHGVIQLDKIDLRLDEQSCQPLQPQPPSNLALNVKEDTASKSEAFK